MRYHNLDLVLGRGRGDGYELKALCKAERGHGEAADNSPLDLSKLQRGQAVFEGGTTDRQFLRQWGILLYGYLFPPGPLERQFYKCLGATLEKPDEGVRLRLRIDTDVPELASLAWEFAYVSGEEEFIGTSTRTSLVRYIDTPRPIRELRTATPVRMLVVIPEGTGLDTAAEKEYLAEAVRDLVEDGVLEIEMLEGRDEATRTRVSDALRERPFHILHFIGHGAHRDDQSVLVLNGTDEPEDPVPHEWWARLFANHRTMKLVVLNACEGATVSSTRPMVGMAPQLVAHGIPAVVAMQYAIADPEALCFARVFYRSLFLSMDRGRVDVAMCHARNQLLMEFPDTPAVGAPVLFMRAPEGLLFDIATDGVVRNLLRLLPSRAVDTARAVVKTHEHNIAVSSDEDFIAREREDRNAVRKRIRLRNASLVAAAGAALMAFFLLWLGAFDWLPKQLKPEHYIVGLADLSSGKSLDDALAFVPITVEDTVRLGKGFGASWREEHGVLTERLSQAGARVIAFDVYFPEPSDHDAGFARAIREARANGTDVIVGVMERAEDGGLGIPDEIRESANAWGTLCMGLSRQAANVTPLLARHDEGSVVQYLPALSLQAVAAFRGATRYDFDEAAGQVNLLDANSRAVARIPVTAVRTSGPQSRCTIIGEGDRVAEMILDYSPLDSLRARRYSYAEIVQAPGDLDPALFDGRIVLIGAELPDLRDDFSVWRGLRTERRFGYQLHADAMNTLLQGIVIRRMGAGGQFLIIVGMALLGAALALRAPRRSLTRRLSLILILAAYMAVALILYATAHVFINALYHVLAFIVSYLMVRTMKRRFFP